MGCPGFSPQFANFSTFYAASPDLGFEEVKVGDHHQGGDVERRDRDVELVELLNVAGR